MATYKKRGNKVKKKEINEPQEVEASIEEIEKDSTTAEVFNTLDETASKSEQWIEKNSKPLFFGFIAATVILLGYFAYNNFIKAPKEVEAADELAFSKAYFDEAINSGVENDSLYKLALQDTDGKYGLLSIIEKYGNTNAGNLARYMAGISYLKTDKYKEAIEQLDNFKTEDENLMSLAYGNIGDAFSDMEQFDKALEYYEKAANTYENSFTSPIYLLKAGKVALKLENYSKAISLFEKIKNKYSTSDEAKSISSYLNRAKLAQQK